jgi:hypothetical protein
MFKRLASTGLNVGVLAVSIAVFVLALIALQAVAPAKPYSVAPVLGADCLSEFLFYSSSTIFSNR